MLQMIRNMSQTIWLVLLPRRLRCKVVQQTTIYGNNTNFTRLGIYNIPILKGESKVLTLCFRLQWEIHFKEPDEVGANMAESAIGSISTMAYRNPQIPINSLVPYLGSHIEVKWFYLIPLLAGVTGAHLTLFLLNIYAT